MPVMEGGGVMVKPRSRAASLDGAPAGAQQQNGGGRETEEAVSEGEGVARAAAALVSVKVDVDEGARPLIFRGDGTAANVKEEPREQAAMSSGGGSDEEDAGEMRGAHQLGVKRRAETGAGSEASKRSRRADLDQDDEEDDREKMVRSFVEAATSEGAEEAARCADALRNELNMLKTLSDAKEREWNQVIRLRALKDEMLQRLERRRTVLNLGEPLRRGGSSRPRPILPKPPLLNGAPNSVIGEGRQGPILDVRSIIADYRSRHPETVPRRGRRLKPGGSSPARPSELSELSSLLSEALHRPNTADNSRPSSADSSRSGVPLAEPSISFKDVLVKFAKMSQNDQQHQTTPRLPYPEVTLHPVAPIPSNLGPASSLLQGILSKPGNVPLSSAPRATNFSPTLARLLTAPERPTPHSVSSQPPAPAVSISDLLGPTKGRTEITITPVASQVSKSRGKSSDVVVLENENNGDDDDGEERDESGDRLVIDEAQGDLPVKERRQQRQQLKPRQRTQGDDNEEEEEVPECQGCHRSQAQFVCAGCGNQWYCSRECQVAAWDDHSEVCSG